MQINKNASVYVKKNRKGADTKRIENYNEILYEDPDDCIICMEDIEGLMVKQMFTKTKLCK